MTHNEKVKALIGEFDLDTLDVCSDGVYIHCGRDLSNQEFERLAVEIKAIQSESGDDIGRLRIPTDET